MQVTVTFDEAEAVAVMLGLNMLDTEAAKNALFKTKALYITEKQTQSWVEDNLPSNEGMRPIR
jgi:hypothetical protein